MAPRLWIVSRIYQIFIWYIEKFRIFALGNKPRYGWGISLSAKTPPRASPKGKHPPRIPGASLEGWSLWPSLLCFSIPPLRWCSTGLFRECGAWLPQSSWHFQFPGNHNALLSSSRTLLIAVLLWSNCGHFLGSGQDCIELENRQCGQVWTWCVCACLSDWNEADSAPSTLCRSLRLCFFW